MTEQEINQFCEEELIAAKEGASDTTILLAIRKRITARILQDIAPELDAARLKMFMVLEDAVPIANWLANVIAQYTGKTSLVVFKGVTPEMMEGSVRLYEQWGRMLVFLLDVYDTAPRELRSAITKQELQEILVEARKHHDMEFDSLGKYLTTFIMPGDISRIQGTIRTVRLVILGKDRHKEFNARFLSAFRVVEAHSLFAPSDIASDVP